MPLCGADGELKPLPVKQPQPLNDIVQANVFVLRHIAFLLQGALKVGQGLGGHTLAIVRDS